jgi:hypothetical protein
VEKAGLHVADARKADEARSQQSWSDHMRSGSFRSRAAELPGGLAAKIFLQIIPLQIIPLQIR